MTTNCIQTENLLAGKRLKSWALKKNFNLSSPSGLILWGKLVGEMGL